MNPRVQSVVAKADFKLELTFTNGEVGLFDRARFLDFGVFQELRAPGYFQLVRAVDGTVEWPHGQDICPDTLYEDSLKLVRG